MKNIFYDYFFEVSVVLPILNKMSRISKGRFCPSLVTIACPVCGSERRTKVYHGNISEEKLNSFANYSYEVWLDGHHPIVQCRNCGLYYACPRDSQESLAHVYAAGSVESYLRETEGKLASFKREASFLKQLVGRGGKLLEIGCATGLFLRAATEVRFDVWGCDPWYEATTIAKKEFGERINVNTFRATAYEAESFQVVAVWDVIEHVEEPAKLIQDAYDLLAPGGWLALSTPNFDSLSRRLLGSHWQFFERPHLVFFNPSKILNLLHVLGFTDVRILSQDKTYSISYFASYLAKWSPMLSQIALAFVNLIDRERQIMLTLPSGCMRVYGQKPL